MQQSNANVLLFQFVEQMFSCANGKMMKLSENLIKHLSEVPFSQWNIHKLTFQFIEEKSKCQMTNQSALPIKIGDVGKEDLASIDKLLEFILELLELQFHPESYYEISTKNIGRFIIRKHIQLKECLSPWIGPIWNEKINQLITLRNHKMSLLDFSHTMSISDVRAFLLDESYSLPLFDSTFLKCFQVHYEWKSISPCSNMTHYPDCLEYCKAHYNMISSLNLKEQLVLMRYGLPQRKMTINSVIEEETFASRLLGNITMINSLKSSNLSPVPFALFCSRKDLGYQGYVMDGITEKVCDSYFPMPTDEGICFSENMDIKQMLRIDQEEYNVLFEKEKQTSPDTKINGGSRWSEKKIVIHSHPLDLQMGHSKTNNENDLDTVKLQIHDKDVLADILPQDKAWHGISPILLTSGLEYLVEVTPVVQTSTQSFKDLSAEKRNCFFKSEGLKDSSFKKYSQQNCKYECYVLLSREMCQCKAWDFTIPPTQGKYLECDVFGRSCFHAALKHFSADPKDWCPQCKNDCEFVKFQKRVTVLSKKITKAKPINGILQENVTFLDNFWFKDVYRHNLIKKMSIIVNIRMMKPKIDVLDVKYSIWDKFANVGGNFGIFAEIVGCSFLGLLNFVILGMKIPPSGLASIIRKGLKRFKKKKSKSQQTPKSKLPK